MIRLLEIVPGSPLNTIECNILYMSLGSPVEYGALSWTWRSDGCAVPILVNGNAIDISQNLFSALLHLRKRQVPLLWVDYICINQEDLKERASQVKLMKDVYQTAHCVWVWLGDEDKLSTQAFDHMHGMIQHRNFGSIDELLPDWTVDPDLMHPKKCEALSSILSRPWFRRVWILQEVIAARSAVMVCGSDIISMEQFLVIIREFFRAGSLESIMLHHPMQSELRQLTETIKEQLQFILNAYYGSGEFWFQKRYKPKLLNVLFNTRLTEASDPLDKVYGILGLTQASDSKMIRVDYETSAERLSIDVTKAIISKTQSLEILRVAAKLGTESRKLPTWVPNWANTNSQNTPQGALAGDYYESDLAESDHQRRISPASRLSVKFGENDTLIVKGSEVDVIVAVSMHDLEPIMSSYFDDISLLAFDVATKQSGPASVEAEAAMIDHLLEFLSRVHSWCAYWATLTPKSSRYYTGELVGNAFWTLIDTTTEKYSREGPDSLAMFLKRIEEGKICLQMLKERLSNGPDIDTRPEVEQVISQVKFALGPALEVGGAVVRRGAFATTKKRYMGFVPPIARPGDLICCVWGFELPLLLRRKEANRVEFLGIPELHGFVSEDKLDDLSRIRSKRTSKLVLV